MDAQLGTRPSQYSQRDAVHVAIIPVIAGENLDPGNQVIVEDGEALLAIKWKDAHGVVDPFLNTEIRKDELVWVCLNPNSVTGMRHHWRHPDFPDNDAAADAEKAESEAWLREYAARVSHYDLEDGNDPFLRLISGLESGELFFYGSNLHGFFDLYEPDLLRFHAERFLGKPIKGWDEFSYRCSC